MKTLARGFTFIELLIVLAIAALIASAATPMISDYSVNSRLREGGSLLLADALFAQSEALKRNTNVRFAVTTNALAVTQVDSGEVLRQRTLPAGVQAAATTLVFGGSGRPAVFGTSASVDLSSDSVSCSSQYRCPRLIVDGGGGVRLCANQQDCSSL